MTEFRKAAGGPVPVYATKLDGGKLIATGKPYKPQEKSGRAAIIAMARDGILIGTLIKKAADAGYHPTFTKNALIKHCSTDNAAYKFQPPSGQTLEEWLGSREKVRRSPEAVAKSALRAKEREARREARAAAKAAKAKAKADKAADKAAKKPVTTLAEAEAREPKKRSRKPKVAA